MEHQWRPASSGDWPFENLWKHRTANLGGATYKRTTRADSRSGRDRLATSGGFSDLYRDFVFEQVFNQASGENFGRNYIKLVLSGLTRNSPYEFTGFAREDAFNSTDFTDPNAPSVSFQAWSDLRLAGRFRRSRRVDETRTSAPVQRMLRRLAAH